MASAPQTAHSASGSFTLIQPGRRLFTLADVAALPEHLPSGAVSFELHHGRLVPMSPPGATHGNLQIRLGSALVTQGEEKGHGKAYTEVGVVLARNPDHLVGADAAFVTKRSIPVRETKEGFLETIPELVVEIRSKNDTTAEIDEKVTDYLNAGVHLVWIVDPDPESVSERRPNLPPNAYRKTETLTCQDIIPGFRLALADLFRP
jgi:Uma2 family endonuclease